jgi:hypothetical protein
VITFFARDASGNETARQARLTVLLKPPPGTPPLPVPPAAKPPPDVGRLAATPGNHSVRLTWDMPTGVDHVEVTRWASATRKLSAESPGVLVYTGTGRSYVDRGLTNGVEYRYVITTVDAAGNKSAGRPIVVVPRRDLLRSPKNGQRLRKPPRLVWEADRKASYYNAQLIRDGEKILSVWPRKPRYTLRKRWRFSGRTYSLKPGIYHWYVWPGYGPRSDVTYGELLGTRMFEIAP